MPLSQYKKSAGFTLVELMLVVAVITILTVIAYPSYQDSVRKARRAQAQADLVQYAAFAERTFTESNSYANATLAASGIQNTNFYNYAIPTLNATDFVITATPQAASGQNNDPCGTMSLADTGFTTPPIAGCWQ